MLEGLCDCREKDFLDGQPDWLVEIGHLAGLELSGLLLLLKDLVNLLLLLGHSVLVCGKKGIIF